MDKCKLLAQINRELPANVDWKAGAERYVASCFKKLGQQAYENYSFNKPFGLVGPEDPAPAITECVHYINNFSNALALLKPRLGSRVLDVACGGGWVSHFLSKMGYWTYGIDISRDFIDLASDRLASDQTLHMTKQEAASRFAVLDIESTPLPENLLGTFDIVWLESCLHHFVDPVSTLGHLVDALKPNGLVILVEFENRQGKIKEEYMAVMHEFETLERPYSRSELENALQLVGLNEYEFMGTVNGWFSPHDPVSARMDELLIHGAGQMNLAICAKQKGRLDEIFPHRKNDQALEFGRGFYENVNGNRWCSPSAEVTTKRSVKGLQFEVHRSLPSQNQRDQVIVAYGAAGELGRLTLTPSTSSGQLFIGDVTDGERITLHSVEAFRPSWRGGNDNRLLSFYIKID